MIKAEIGKFLAISPMVRFTAYHRMYVHSVSMTVAQEYHQPQGDGTSDKTQKDYLQMRMRYGRGALP
jgi:hypothetical protein